MSTTVFTFLNGWRKVVMIGMGLAALMILAMLARYGGLPPDALGNLIWGVVFLVSGGIGGNVMEHFSKRAPAPAAVHNGGSGPPHSAAAPAGPQPIAPH